MSYFWIIRQSLEWNIPLGLISLFLLSIYFCMLTIRKIRLQKKQYVFFFCGIVLFYLLVGSPLYTLSHLSFITHMLHISLLFFLIPPLLLLGIPKSLFLNRKLMKLQIDPYLNIILFALFLYLYHTPAFLSMLTEEKGYHEIFLFIMILLSIFLWIPSISARINKNECFSISYKKVNIWLITPSCLILIILPSNSANPLLNDMLNLCLPTGVDSTLFKPIIPPQLDQQIAGLFMFLMHKMGMVFAHRSEKHSSKNNDPKCSIDFFFKHKF
ncbi:cytochrome c oxidase assembly protein [Heyndrickxia oleronia]|uniref:cytochrome c oxidase assembly protein n=1 Tax=Heyndrickxia oleronia TaxID=38875 RepID=UPI00203D03F0|nr:cytochrome c oxidase assembly protein [Heyndrickxia oleronia]MCM3237199.1 cytochrome c oxidase assembly protein [Heyndrickxia oleronia]